MEKMTVMVKVVMKYGDDADDRFGNGGVICIIIMSNDEKNVVLLDE